MTTPTTQTSDLAHPGGPQGKPLGAFSVGFKGATLEEVMPWAVEAVGDSRKVVVAMAGSGRDIAAFARRGRYIRSYDPQEISRLVVDGLFSITAPECGGPAVRSGAIGYATEHRPIPGMPDDCAMLADYIAIAGTDHDRAALSWALVRSTFQGRLSSWSRDRTFTELYEAFKRAWHKLEPWHGLPGTFDHVKGSVFGLESSYQEAALGAVVFVDTPKVINKGRHGDIYSGGFAGLNSILAQSEQHLPAWTEDTFKLEMPGLFGAAWQRLVLFHTNDAKPGPAWLEAAFAERGFTVVERRAWNHRGRLDLAWIVEQ